jgi:hypothetical protein
MTIRSRAAAIAVATTALCGAVVAPALADNYTTECGNNICATIDNSYQGSDFVKSIYVWIPNCVYGQQYEPGYFIGGQQRDYVVGYTCSQNFTVGYSVDKKKCVQGSDGYSNTSDKTTCWYAP